MLHQILCRRQVLLKISSLICSHASNSFKALQMRKIIKKDQMFLTKNLTQNPSENQKPNWSIRKKNTKVAKAKTGKLKAIMKCLESKKLEKQALDFWNLQAVWYGPISKTYPRLGKIIQMKIKIVKRKELKIWIKPF